jgi:hypothetical protein
MWDFPGRGPSIRTARAHVGTAPIRPVSEGTAQHLRMNVRMSMRKLMRMHVHHA